MICLYVSTEFPPPPEAKKSGSCEPLNIVIISYLCAPVNPLILQTFLSLFMEHPILKKRPPRVIIKLPQRSESHVQVNLKTTEREVTKNAGTQQLHEVTPRIAGINC